LAEEIDHSPLLSDQYLAFWDPSGMGRIIAIVASCALPGSHPPTATGGLPLAGASTKAVFMPLSYSSVLSLSFEDGASAGSGRASLETMKLALTPSVEMRPDGHFFRDWHLHLMDRDDVPQIQLRKVEDTTPGTKTFSIDHYEIRLEAANAEPANGCLLVRVRDEDRSNVFKQVTEFERTLCRLCERLATSKMEREDWVERVAGMITCRIITDGGDPMLRFRLAPGGVAEGVKRVDITAVAHSLTITDKKRVQLLWIVTSSHEDPTIDEGEERKAEEEEERKRKVKLEILRGKVSQQLYSEQARLTKASKALMSLVAAIKTAGKKVAASTDKETVADVVTWLDTVAIQRENSYLELRRQKDSC
jgi:hypothetical protein